MAEHARYTLLCPNAERKGEPSGGRTMAGRSCATHSHRWMSLTVLYWVRGTGIVSSVGRQHLPDRMS
jgi:hypothetical protein